MRGRVRVSILIIIALDAGLAATAGFQLHGSKKGLGPAFRNEALASLVETERAFSSLSEEKGIRQAFLTYLGPDAVVFRPGPVEGRPIYESMPPDSPAVLTWEPEIADVSVSGELGYTSGPYRVKPNRQAKPSGFGHYVSVWKKQPDGTWKVLLDAGVSHGPPSPQSAVRSVISPPPRAGFEPLSPEALRDAEKAFGQRAALFEELSGRNGQGRTYKDFAVDDIRVFRPGTFPAVGGRALKSLVPADAGRVSPGSGRRWASFKVGLSWAADIAYSFGTFQYWKAGTVVETTAFLRIWRRGRPDSWRICLDLELPVPPPGQKDG